MLFSTEIAVLLSCEEMKYEETNFFIEEEIEAENGIIFGLMGLQPFFNIYENEY